MEKEEFKIDLEKSFERGLKIGQERREGLGVRYFDSRDGLCGLGLQVMWPVCDIYVADMWPNGLRDLWTSCGIGGGFADGFRMIGKASRASLRDFFAKQKTSLLRASLARSCAGGFGLLMQGSYVDGFRMIGKASRASSVGLLLSNARLCMPAGRNQLCG
ncbi:MAG: hypothetical protein KKF74_04275, partial [Nanoarchaeota archaeon]|nr:hypothetical protein [Nanoarchaeota archaeon]